MQRVRGSISSAVDSSRPAGGGPTPNTPVVSEEFRLPDGTIVYENETSVGDLYQKNDHGQENLMRGGYSPSSNTITLTQNSDLSTVAHELGHWYLETILDLSKVEGVDPAITEDAQALLKEFGFDSVDAWQAASRNTPAEAGKTVFFATASRHLRKHPRRGGEDEVFSLSCQV